MRYLNLTLRFEADGEGQLRVRLADPDLGRARSDFHPPVAAESLEALLFALEGQVLAKRGTERVDPAPERLDLEGLGRELFSSLFEGPLGEALAFRLGQLQERQQEGLRLRLVVDPEDERARGVLGLPWELAAWPERAMLWGRDPRLSVVRFLEVDQPGPPALTDQSLLRVLLVAAAPSDQPALNLEAEIRHIEKACGEQPAIELHQVASGRLADAAEAAARIQPQICHFLGHGGVEPSTSLGMLYFKTLAGTSDPVSGRALAEALAASSCLRVVVLNACEGARFPRQACQNAFGAAAAALVRAGVPAVVANQFPISDGAACAFSRAFYATLAGAGTLETAVALGRQGTFLADRGSYEWITPTLYSRTDEALSVLSPTAAAAPEIQARVIDQGGLITEKTTDFVGRVFAFEALERFLATRPQGYFLVEGDPGIGKTSLLAECVRRFGWPHHFNVRSAGLNQVDRSLANLCAQLIRRYRLPYSQLPADATRDSAFLSRLLGEILARRTDGKPLVAVVDALDEVDTQTLPEGANPLCLPPTLPEGAFLVVSSRRPERPYAFEAESFEIDQGSAANRLDVAAHIRQRLERPGIRAFLAARHLGDEELVAQLADKSYGNFMYLHYVLGDIERLGAEYSDLAQLPDGLKGYYEQHWQRMRGRDVQAWAAFKVKVLEALTVTKEAIPFLVVAGFSEVENPSLVRMALEEWRPFLHEEVIETDEGPEKGYRLYHGSFFDFVKAKDEIADGEVDLREARRRILRYLDRLP